MNILFIGPLPPPVTGHSLVDQVLVDELKLHHTIRIVDTNKNSFVSGFNDIKRIFQIFKILKLVWNNRKNNDSIYLTISESIAGNLKDICIYLICFNQLNRMTIHLHGGSFKKDVLDKRRILKSINIFFLKKLKKVIISGKSHIEIFSDFLSKEKIAVIPNFASDNLFVDKNTIQNKFKETIPLNILFISNLIEGKGYMELVNAYLGLDLKYKQKITINIAGGADPEHIKKTNFIEKISNEENIHYHGFINEEQKRSLLEKAHILCFPSYLMEGQGLVVLEAYASGCVVITTASGGIKDIFSDGINGYQLEIKSSDSIKKSFEQILSSPKNLLPIAIKNWNTACHEYRASTYTSRIIKMLEN